MSSDPIWSLRTNKSVICKTPDSCIDAFLLGCGPPADVYSEFTHQGEQMPKNVQLWQHKAHSGVHWQKPNRGPSDYRWGEFLIFPTCNHPEVPFKYISFYSVIDYSET